MVYAKGKPTYELVDPDSGVFCVAGAFRGTARRLSNPGNVLRNFAAALRGFGNISANLARRNALLLDGAGNGGL
jgi:hypothetical protein